MQELRNLHYFVAAASCGSFRKAAAALGVRGSTISRRISDLEDQLGASLFQRHCGGVFLTMAGQRFLRRARDALQHLEDGINDVAAIGRSEAGYIKIGIFSSLASGFLFELLRMHNKNHPDIEVVLINSDPSEHVAAIRQLRLDIAFVTGTTRWDDCESEHLWSEAVFAVLPNEHPLATKERLCWGDLFGEKFIVSNVAPGREIRDYLVQHLADLGRHPEICTQYVGRDVLLSMVAVGRGLTLTSEATTSVRVPGIVYRPICSETMPYCAVWSSRNDNPACLRFLRLARSMSQACNSAC